MKSKVVIGFIAVMALLGVFMLGNKEKINIDQAFEQTTQVQAAEVKKIEMAAAVVAIPGSELTSVQIEKLAKLGINASHSRGLQLTAKK